MPALSGIVRAAIVWTGRILLTAFFLAGLLILVGRYFLVPEITTYRADVEQQLSQQIGLPAKIGSLSASWRGVRPILAIGGLAVHDREGRPALSFDSVEAEIGWSSLWHFGLHLHRLEIIGPALDIRQTVEGRLFIAGLPIEGEGDSGFARWLLDQGRIVVRDARLVWHDEKRGAPPLELHNLNFDLRNSGNRHAFGLTADPPEAAASRLDVRGNLIGSDPAALASWRGALYLDLERVDLLAWLPWFDMPLDLTRGKGGLRLWLDFAHLQPTGFTADLRLADVAMRLRSDLPVIDLESLQGNLRGQRIHHGYSGEVRRLSLTTRDGLVMAPTSVKLLLDQSPRRASSTLTANNLDLGVLANLANHLPLPEYVHQRLRSLAPQGVLTELEVNWRGPVDAPEQWQSTASFAGLSLSSYRELPGFSGMTGTLDGDSTSGALRIDSQNASLVLPGVFAEATVPLASLQAEMRWRTSAQAIDFELVRAVFRNADADGDASGSYRYTGNGLGDIDLSARLNRADGNAVWRYMPLVVNKDARDWLQTSIVGGHSENVTLRLKGPLDAFPFSDGKRGIFQVKGRIIGATLDYAAGWPKITGIDGELLFEGIRMLIRAQHGNIMGTTLSNVTAEIADLAAHEELLRVAGNVRGETQQFLDFIQASPVGQRIDHFTETMSAKGKGELELKLDLPLRQIERTRIDGRYRFADNEVIVMPELPPLQAAQGSFTFTGDRMQAKGLRARLMGAPVSFDIATTPGGTVRVDAKGTLKAQALRQSMGSVSGAGLRAFDHLSGEAAWRGSVTVKKPVAEIRVESTLTGLSSSLPEPFNKSVSIAMPLKFGARLEPGQNSFSLSLADVAEMRLSEAGTSRRGRIALGEAAQSTLPALPERGIAIAIAQPNFDIDAWRALLTGPESGVAATAALPLTALDLRVGALTLLQRDFHDVKVTGTASTGPLRLTIDSRELRGQLGWDEKGAGRLTGKLAHVHLPPAGPPAAAATASEAPRPSGPLPAVDLVIDSFRVRDMALGEVRVNGETRDGIWQAKVGVKNEAAMLNGDVRWRAGGSAEETKASFRLEIADWEKLLGLLGMPDAVRRGKGWIKGELAWPGAPAAYDLNHLTGTVETEIDKGQFKKLEPGVGRLLGVLSLQSLPRRITLDFRDVFSEGFAFDSIAGSAQLGKGVMTTEQLAIRGPAARVLLSGKVNLAAETQDLKVRVQPAIGDTVAMGAMIANPVAGAVVWLAQKALSDPLDQAFAYEYAVTGPWADPKVDKLGVKAP